MTGVDISFKAGKEKHYLKVVESNRYINYRRYKMSEKLKPKKVVAPVAAPKTEKIGKSATKKNITIIAKCDCISEFQDKTYGKGNRIKNSTGNGGTRCSVCGK